MAERFLQSLGAVVYSRKSECSDCIGSSYVSHPA